MAMSSEAASVSSSTIPPRKYDVFLSFRGEDTRTGFTDHLHAALQQRGIITFIDDELQRGEVISDQLLQAIDDSLVSLVILSENYASSRWCLDELQRILESKKSFRTEVIPVFYKIDPSHVRHQKGTFADAFRNLVDRYPEKEQGWRDALKQVAYLSGYHSANRHETKLIEEIVKDVWTKLQAKQPSDENELVGIESKIEYLINSVLRIGSNDICLLGIWGMGGIGKTSLARAVYQRICYQFDLSYFYADVNEVSKKDGLANLQKQFLCRYLNFRSMEFSDAYEGRYMIRRLLCNKRVLIVVDDASEMSQLDYLAIKKDWLGTGSRVIVTTRDKHLLTAHGEFEMHEAILLNPEESLKLFCRWAFKSERPTEDYSVLSERVVKLAAGLPLTLKVLGCHLCGRDILEWKDALEKIKKVPPEDVMKRLRISYEALDPIEKEIFLDIACCFKGMPKDKVIQTLETCGFHPTIGIRQLVDKCLLVECYYEGAYILSVHDILQEMAESIVLERSPRDVGRRSRIWSKEDMNNVLANNKGSDSIEVIFLQSSVQYKACWCPEAFSKMSNLRILIISCDVCLPHGLKCLPSSLKLLEWERYPCTSLPLGVHPNELVELRMHCSKIKRLWNKIQISEKLKLIDLSYSEYLIQTPDVSMLPNLEQLLLEGCIKLVKVHPSLGHHKKIVAVNLKDCRNLKALPRILEMDSLNELILSGCSQLQVLPEFGETMKCLSLLELKDCRNLKALPRILEIDFLNELILSGCSQLQVLPEFGETMKCLSLLELKDCKNLVCLPGSLCHLKSLKTLNTFGCSKLLSLPENLDENESMEELDISGTAIREIPSSINGLKRLRKLHADGCTRSCDSLQNFLSITLRLVGFNSYKAPIRLTLPPCIFGLSSLKELKLSNCYLTAESIPNDLGCLPSLENLDLSGNNFGGQPAGKCLLPPSFLSLSSLRYLTLQDCNLCDGSIPDNLCSLSSLQSIDLSRNNFTHLPAGVVSNLLALKCLNLEHCNRLLSLPRLPPNIECVGAHCCHPSIEALDFLELLSNFFSKTDFDDQLRWNTTPLYVVIPGSEIPSWFSSADIHFLDEFSGSRSRQFFMDNEKIGDHYLDCIVSVPVELPFYGSLRYLDDDATKRWGVCLCIVVQETMPGNSRNRDSMLRISFAAKSGLVYDLGQLTFDLEGNKPQLIFWFWPSHCADRRMTYKITADRRRVEYIIAADRRRSLFEEQEAVDKSEGKSESRGRVLIKKCGYIALCKEDIERLKERVHEEPGLNYVPAASPK